MGINFDAPSDGIDHFLSKPHDQSGQRSILDIEMGTGLEFDPSLITPSVSQEPEIRFESELIEPLSHLQVITPMKAPVDHDWLTNVYQHSPLPQQKQVVPQLESLWLHKEDPKQQLRIEGSLPKQRYASTERGDLESPLWHYQKALRMITAGAPISDIEQVAKSLTPDLRNRLSSALDDYGLAGKTHIWAEAYPDCHTGKWGKEITRTAKTATFLVGADKCVGCSFATSEGHCGVLGGKELVEFVPWGVVAQQHQALIRTKNLRIGSSDPKELVRAALAPTVRVAKPITPQYAAPTPVRTRTYAKLEPISSEQIRAQEAGKTLNKWAKMGLLRTEQVADLMRDPETAISKAAALITEIRVSTYDKAYQVYEARLHSDKVASGRAFSSSFDFAAWAEKRKIAELDMDPALYQDLVSRGFGDLDLWRRAEDLKSLRPLVRMGSLTETEASAMLDRGLSPYDIVFRGHQATYQGEGTGAVPGIDDQTLGSILDKVAESQARIQQTLTDYRNEAFVEQFRTAYRDGYLTESEVRAARQKGASNLDVLDLLQRRMEEAKVLKPIEHKTYQGYDLKFHYGDTRTATTRVTPEDVQRAASWIMGQMHLGKMGDRLTQEYEAMFTPLVRKAAQRTVDALRREHEGLAGVVYVEASAFQQDGVKGCERGAALLKTSSVPYVKGSDLCVGCVHLGEDLSGVVSCQHYARELIVEVPGDRKALQAKAIRTANLSLSKKTARIDLQNPVAEMELGVLSGLENTGLDQDFSVKSDPEMEIELNNEWSIGSFLGDEYV